MYDLTPAAKLSMTLRFLAGGVLHDIHRDHGCSFSCARKVIWKTIAAILENEDIGSFDFDPRDPDYLDQKSDLFRSRRLNDDVLAPHVVGAVDGLAIRISNPVGHVDNPVDYFSRKGFFALNCQGLCDVNRRFLLFTCNSPGSSHDSVAFSLSQHYQDIQQGLVGTDSTKPLFIVGDNAYSISLGLLTPFSRRRNGLSIQQDAFNYYLSSCRAVIECAFGMLIQRWGIFWRRLNLSPEAASRVIICCAKLHNFILDFEGPIGADRIFESGNEYQNHLHQTTDHPEPLGPSSFVAFAGAANGSCPIGRTRNGTSCTLLTISEITK
uniref:DDE Tnp4 domain-containing protein n=1 Tax=Paramoeba aestuarina TaxID=180227 RepID=A0A7S4JR71_9EUKA|mmetsp:Transcript_12459/g.19050  ORF Transcript_12459/g.19050 Transcript_12459/m.19050 type:complete len:324 (+) Transcript_12459:350-1321(+)